VGEVAVIELSGRLTIGAGLEVFKQKVFELLESGTNKILLNCAGIDFMDSAGLGEIVNCCTVVSRRGGALKLCCVPPRIMDLLRMTRLTNMLRPYPEEKDGLEALGAQPAEGTRSA
jgi:anti-sigma B factor antagonist